MDWDHKGISINTLSNGKFVAEFSGVRIVKNSLSAVKKEIDVRLEMKAKEEVLKFPVLVLRKSSRFSNEHQRDVISAVITGIDPDSLRVKGLEDKNNWVNEAILPASKENQKLLDDYIFAEAEFKRLKDLVDRRDIDDRYGNSFGPKIGYDEAVKKLKESYKKAQSA